MFVSVLVKMGFSFSLLRVEFSLHRAQANNSSLDKFPHNTLTEYRVSLAQTLNLTGEWEVVLSEIHSPHSWNNI